MAHARWAGYPSHVGPPRCVSCWWLPGRRFVAVTRHAPPVAPFPPMIGPGLREGPAPHSMPDRGSAAATGSSPPPPGHVHLEHEGGPRVAGGGAGEEAVAAP